MGAAVSKPAADSHLTSLKLDSGDPVKKRFGVTLSTKLDLWQSKTILGGEGQSIHNQYGIRVVKYMHIPSQSYTSYLVNIHVPSRRILSIDQVRPGYLVNTRR